MSVKKINSLEEDKTMITFILGMLVGGFLALIILSLVIAGKNSDLIKENDRLKHRVQDQAKRLFSSWSNWKDEKERGDFLEIANEQLEAEKNKILEKLNPGKEEDKIPTEMFLSRM